MQASGRPVRGTSSSSRRESSPGNPCWITRRGPRGGLSPTKRRTNARSSFWSCAKLVASLLHGGLKALVLGHLSETNNEPRLAFQATHSVLKGAVADEDITLLVARQGQPGSVLDVA